jgi:hypothetical protein
MAAKYAARLDDATSTRPDALSWRSTTLGGNKKMEVALSEGGVRTTTRRMRRD